MAVHAVYGTVNGSVRVTDDVTILTGNGPSQSRLVCSPGKAALWWPWDPSITRRFLHFQIDDLTIDGNGGAVGINLSRDGGPMRSQIRNVKIVNCSSIALAVNDVDCDITNLTVEVAGRAVTINGDRPFAVKGFAFTGGLGGVITNEVGCTSQRIIIHDGRIDLAYWERSGTDTTATVAGLTVTLADWPDVVQVYDQIRFGEGTTSILGRVLSWNAQAMTMTVQRWRSVRNSTVATPRNGACTVIPRHTDVGGIHLTKNVSHAWIENVAVDGGFSDMITMRGKRNVAVNCRVSRGQDCGYTIEGPHCARECRARDVNFSAFVAIDPGGTHLVDCDVSGQYAQAFDDRFAHWTRKKDCSIGKYEEAA